MAVTINNIHAAKKEVGGEYSAGNGEFKDRS